MKYLRQSIGFDGWRFDFVRGYPGQFAKQVGGWDCKRRAVTFTSPTLDALQYVDETVPEMAFGEYWDSCDYTDGVLNYNQDAHR
jgi:alpha-amylase